jgi:hypothetical protein
MSPCARWAGSASSSKVSSLKPPLPNRWQTVTRVVPGSGSTTEPGQAPFTGNVSPWEKCAGSRAGLATSISTIGFVSELV